MRRCRQAAALTGTAALAMALAGCGAGAGEGAVVEETSAAAAAGAGSSATFQDAEGQEVGTVSFSEVSAGTEVVVEVHDLDPGFYGLHVHGTGLCEPDSAAPDDPGSTGAFLSAGGHLGGENAEHPEHAGDLPSLYVTEDGLGLLMTVTDRFAVQDLADDDGSAVMIHSGPDNYANIPERYAPDGPDEQSRGTGDAGPRLACGVVE